MRRLRSLILVAFVFFPSAASAQGNPVGPEFRVNTYTTGLQGFPSVGSDVTGNFVVIWQSNSQDGSSAAVMGQRYGNAGVPLGPEFRINTYTTGFQGTPKVGEDAVGNFVAVWTSLFQDGSDQGVFGQRYASTGTAVGPEFRVNTYTPYRQFLPAVASDASGNFVVVWTSFGQDGSNDGIFGQRYANTGSPTGPEFRVNAYTTSPQRSPSVASDASGNFVVVWQSLGQDGSSYGVFGQRYGNTGVPVGPEFRVNTYTTNYQGTPVVASDVSGNFVVVWVSLGQDGSSYGIFGQRYAATGARLGPEFAVNTYTTGFQGGVPGVASDGSGNFVVVWTSAQDGSSYGAFGQRYENTGAALGTEFRVNTYTTSLQAIPVVASDTSGNFVVIWESDNQDGSNYGVFGQRYSPIFPVALTGFRVE